MSFSNCSADVSFYGDGKVLKVGIAFLLFCVAVSEHLLGSDKKTRVDFFKMTKENSYDNEEVEPIGLLA